jgi:hypothetical protein
VSIIFLPLTFITGFFGMNFGWMTQMIGSADAFVLLGVILPTLCVALALAWLRRSRLICWGKESHRSKAKLRYTMKPEGNELGWDRFFANPPWPASPLPERISKGWFLGSRWVS